MKQNYGIQFLVTMTGRQNLSGTHGVVCHGVIQVKQKSDGSCQKIKILAFIRSHTLLLISHPQDKSPNTRGQLINLLLCDDYHICSRCSRVPNKSTLIQIHSIIHCISPNFVGVANDLLENKITPAQI